MDWTNPDQTNMLVDWVRVYERVQPDTATLIDESGNNLPYNRIINSAEFGAAFVDSNLESMAVAPLVGDQVLELDYYTSLSSGGGATADYSAAYFSFNRIDLSDFNNMIFSMDVSRFKNFDDVAVEFEDFNAGKASVRTSNLTPIETIGNWNTYKVPFSDYAGVAMDDIKFLAITSPNDVNNNLLGGKLYLDDIRFTQEACKAQGVITFDSANFNPDTRVGAVNIDDICAAGSLASINVDNGSEQITLGVKLDAAGKGRVTFGLVNGRSICLVDDQESVLPLSGTLTATYTKTLFDEAAVQSTVVVTAQAGVDESAPSTVLAGDELFLYSTDQTLTFLPDNDFAYSVFGSGSVLNGAASDVTFNPAFGVTSGIDYGGGIHVAQIVWLGGEDFPGFAGFADGKQSLNFKIKDLPSNTVKVEVGVAGADVDEVVITDVTSSTFSTPIGSTGWYQIVIPLAEFPASSAADFIAITGTDGGTSEFTFLITDVAVQESLSNVDASCETLSPEDNGGGGDTATGGSVPEVTIYEADGSAADLGPVYTPFGSGTGFATVTDNSYTQALEVTIANGYGPSLAQFALTGLSLTDYDELLFKVKGLTADNTVKVTLEATGGAIVLVDLTSPPSGVTATDLGDGWTQVVMPFTAFGDASSSTVLIFATLDNAYAVGDTFLLTDIGFNNAAVVDQLAVNGDIEVGDLSSFTVNENGGSITADNTQDSGSTWSVHVAAGVGNNPSLSLPNLAVGTVMPGDTIDVSFDMCGTLEGISGAVKPALLSEFGSGEGATRQDLANIETLPSVWTRYNYSASAESNVTGGVSLQLDVVCGAVAGCAADVYFDNVSITIGGGAVPGSASGASCAATPEPGVMLPIDFEDAPYVFLDGGGFGGGQASVEANSQSGGINVSANVGKMLKFADQVYGGSTFDLGGTLAVPANSAFTMKVWASRAVPLLFKLEGGLVGEITATHTGSSTWEELTFDFDGVIGEGNITGITFIYDNGVNGDAAGDPGNWTFYFDDIGFAPLPPTPNVTLFADAFAPGWVGFLDANGTVSVVTDSNATYGEVLEITTGGSTVVGLGSRTGDGVSIDTTRFSVLEFDLKLVTAPTSGTTNWRLKVENPGVEIGITVPVLDTWVRYSIPIGDLGTPAALDLIMLFADYGANAGAVYRLDNVKLLEEASPPPPEDITLFADALATGWVGFLDANGTVTQVTDSNETYGEVLEITTGGSTVVGIGSRATIGGDGVNIDTTGYSAIEFDLKLVTAPATTNWRFKTENPGQEVGIAEPVLDTWVSYSVQISSLGTPNALDLIMLFPDYGANAGAVYRLDNVKLVVSSGGGGGGGEISVNGGLESGLTGWETTPNGGTSELSMVEARTGTSSARLRADVTANGGGASFPDIKLANAGIEEVTDGQAVTVSFWTKTVEQTGAVPFFAQLFTEQSGGGASKTDFLIQPPTFLTTGVWQEHSFDVTLGPDASSGVSLLFKADCGATASCVLEVFIDDVLIIPTPTP
jgi:hypothetical protein